MKTIAAVAAVLGLSAVASFQGPPPSVVPSHAQRSEELSQAALAWLDSLTPELRAKGQVPFEGDERKDWGYVKRTSGGVALGEMSGEQRVLLDQLLRAGLSPQGYMKAHGVITLEEVLGRDPGLYFATVFGHPESEDPWGWRLEGHHLSLNFTVRNGKFVTATPLFFGADPAEVKEGVHAGFRMFYDEEQRVRDVVAQLGPKALRAAAGAAPVPNDIVRGPSEGPTFAAGEVAGVSLGKLGAPQQTRVMQALGAFLGNLHPGLALPMMNRYRDRNLRDIGFLWLDQAQEGGDAFYFRFSSADKAFTVEYWNGGNHVHCVVRDAAEEFGDARIDEWSQW